MNKKERIQKIDQLLKRDYPEVITPLLHQGAWQLVIATALSAQTLDATVNKVTPVLFEMYPNLESLASAQVEEIDKIISSVNYHKTKSKNIIKLAQKLLEEFDGIVPSTIEDLTKLPGVGRKTANVVISEWFAKPLNQRGNPIIDPKILKKGEDIHVLPEGFVVDTHVLRTTFRLGLTKNKTPEKVEKDLMKIFPRDEWNDTSLRLIFHGRFRCKSQNPTCYLDPEWSLICSCVKLREKKLKKSKLNNSAKTL